MTKFSLAATIVAVAMATASCSYVRKVTDKFDKKESKVSKPVINVTPEVPVAETPQPQLPAIPEAKPEAPADSFPEMPVHKTTTMQNAVARSLGGEWSIVKVGNTDIERDDDRPYIIFEPSTGAIYAYNGCNTVNGFYTVEGTDELSFSNLMTTMRACPDSSLDSQINSVIAEGVALKAFVKEVGTETFVELLSNTGESVMRLRRGNLQFLDGQWDVVSINNLPKLEAPASIFFDIAELKIHGNTGCNIVNGQVYMDHRRPNAIDFSNMITTRMACPFETQQTAMLVALEETVSVMADGADRALLLNADGKTIMTLRRASQVYED